MATFERRAFESLNVDDVRAFLAANGLSVVADDSERADLWRGGGIEEGDEVLVPKATSARDYGLRLAELFWTLSHAWNRSIEDLLKAVSETGADVIRLRLASVNEVDASVRLRDGAAMVTGSFDLLYAAACAAVAPRAVLAPRRPLQAVDYMRRVELGQSERGSYIVSLISRVSPQLTPGVPTLFESLEPFPRRVTGALAKALAATQLGLDAVTANGNLEVFDELVREGVSANLCEAIGGLLQREDAYTPVNISVSWATAMPVDVNVPRQFGFVPDSAEVLREAARRLRASEPEQEVLMTGVVTDLHREPSDAEGEVSVMTMLEGRWIKLRVPLPGPEYQRAIESHERRVPVMFRADIEKQGRSWRASGITDFRVIADE